MNIKEEELINIDVMSDEGHSEFSLVPQEALEMINNMVDKEGKWLYINGKFTNNETLSEADLINAEHILLSNKVAGGGIMDAYNVNSKIKEDLHCTLAINLNTGTKNIDISFSSKMLKVLSLHTKLFVNELKLILEAEAASNFNDVAKAYSRNEVKLRNNAEVATFEYSDDIENDLELYTDLNENKVHFVFKESEKFKIINQRKWYFITFGKKINEFIDQEISDMRKIVNI